MEHAFKYFNQLGEGVKESPDGWMVDARKGTSEELEMLMKLLKQFKPVFLKGITDVSAMKNIDFGKNEKLNS